MNESTAHDGLERFARSNGIDYAMAKSMMIDGDAKAGWKHLEYAREHKDKKERDCVRIWLEILVRRAKGEAV